MQLIPRLKNHILNNGAQIQGLEIQATDLGMTHDFSTFIKEEIHLVIYGIQKLLLFSIPFTQPSYGIKLFNETGVNNEYEVLYSST